MKRIAFILLAFVALTVQGQDLQPDCLCTSRHFHRGYENLLQKMLLPNEDKEVRALDPNADPSAPSYDDLVYGRVCGILFRPSFSPESSLYYVMNREEHTHTLVMRVPEKSIWYAAQAPNALYERHEGSKRRRPVAWEDLKLDVKVNEVRMSISEEQAGAISSLLRMAVATSTPLLSTNQRFDIITDEQDNKLMRQYVGLDGEMVVFFHHGVQAECWSPKGGKVGRIYTLAHQLQQIVKDNDASALDALLPEVRSLTQDFRDMLPDWGKEYLELAK